MISGITKDSDIDNTNASTDKIAVVISSSREKTSKPGAQRDTRPNSGTMLTLATFPIIILTAANAAPNGASAPLGPDFWRRSFGVSVKQVDYNGTCCKKFIDEVTTKYKEDCEPVCTECVSSKTKTIVSSKTQTTFNLDICLGIGCSQSRWCGLHQDYQKFNCKGCQKLLMDLCNINSSKPCKQRIKRKSSHYDESHEDSSSGSSKGSHRTKSTDEKQLIDARNTLESAFFSLSSAIKTGRSKTSDEENTDLDIDSDMIVEIVQSTTGAALVIGVIILLYRARNRFNRIVHRTIPKSKYPPPLNASPNSQHPYHVTATQALSAQTSQQHQLAAFTPQSMTGGPNNFHNLHGSLQGMFKATKEETGQS